MMFGPFSTPISALAVNTKKSKSTFGDLHLCNPYWIAAPVYFSFLETDKLDHITFKSLLSGYFHVRLCSEKVDGA